MRARAMADLLPRGMGGTLGAFSLERESARRDLFAEAVRGNGGRRRSAYGANSKDFVTPFTSKTRFPSLAEPWVSSSSSVPISMRVRNSPEPMLG